jgi:myosin heavy subunit
MPDTERKKRKTNEKRAEQNRNAQKAFRQRQNEQIQALKEKESQYNELKVQFEQLQNQYSVLVQENQRLHQDKEQLIHLMDKLRNQNQILQERKPPIKTKIQGNYGIVKGFQYIPRPPLRNPVKIPQWTGLQHTFLSVKSETESISSRKGSTVGSSSAFTTPSHPVNSGCIVEEEEEAPRPVPPTNTGCLLPSTTTHSKDNNLYAGFPEWTPKVDTQKKQLEKQPHHIEFSYTDHPTSHLTQWLPEYEAPAIMFYQDLFMPIGQPLLHHIPFETPRLTNQEFLFESDKNDPFVPFK